jgi:hypothetical protein
VPDTVLVTKSAYSSKRGELTVEAASSGAPGVTLTAFDNTSVGDPVFIGTLTYNARKGRYSGTFSWPTRPVSIRVSSTGGGSATSPVGGR